MILRLSQKLSARIKVSSPKAMPLDDNPFADWTAHLFYVERTQYVIVSNTQSLYSTVFYGTGISNDSKFIVRALGAIREFMEDDGQAFAYHHFIIPASGTVSFGKALDRSVTGSMNELINFAKSWLSGGEMAPHEVGFKLNDVLLSSLARGTTDSYRKPREAFKDMLSASAS